MFNSTDIISPYVARPGPLALIVTLQKRTVFFSLHFMTFMGTFSRLCSLQPILYLRIPWTCETCSVDSLVKIPFVWFKENISRSVSCGFHFASFSVCTKCIWIFWLIIRPVIFCSLSSFDCSQIFWNISCAISSCWEPFHIWLSLHWTNWPISFY